MPLCILTYLLEPRSDLDPRLLQKPLCIGLLIIFLVSQEVNDTLALTSIYLWAQNPRTSIEIHIKITKKCSSIITSPATKIFHQLSSSKGKMKMNSFCHDRDKMMMMKKKIIFLPPILHSYSDHVPILLLKKKYLFIYRTKNKGRPKTTTSNGFIFIDITILEIKKKKTSKRDREGKLHLEYHTGPRIH